jgi:hypothetical protein
MDALNDIRRMVHIHLNYDTAQSAPVSADTGSLEAVRSGIRRYKKWLGYILPATLIAAGAMAIAIAAPLSGALNLPWDKPGIFSIVAYGLLLCLGLIYRKLDNLKKRELFLIMLNRMDRTAP